MELQYELVRVLRQLDPDRPEVVEHRKRLAEELLKTCEQGMVAMSPRTLRVLRVTDFPKGVVIIVRGYRIYCDARDSRVFWGSSARPLAFNAMPRYIREFVYGRSR